MEIQNQLIYLGDQDMVVFFLQLLITGTTVAGAVKHLLLFLSCQRSYIRRIVASGMNAKAKLKLIFV